MSTMSAMPEVSILAAVGEPTPPSSNNHASFLIPPSKQQQQQQQQQQRTSSPARTMNSTASVGSGGNLSTHTNTNNNRILPPTPQQQQDSNNADEDQRRRRGSTGTTPAIIAEGSNTTNRNSSSQRPPLSHATTTTNNIINNNTSEALSVGGTSATSHQSAPVSSFRLSLKQKFHPRSIPRSPFSNSSSKPTTTIKASNNNNDITIPMVESSSTAMIHQQHQQRMTVPQQPTNNTSNNTTNLPPPPPFSSSNSHSSAVLLLEQQQQDQEQALFEHRLLLPDGLGVAIRKINQYGKSNLRYVKCLTVPIVVAEPTTAVSSSSATTPSPNQHRVLSWGRKKDVQLAVSLFAMVRTGKTTDRARRCTSVPSNRIVSLIPVETATNNSQQQQIYPSLDIEAPTVLDRDKFARAFARFLQVPLVSTEDPMSTPPSSTTTQRQQHQPRDFGGGIAASAKPKTTLLSLAVASSSSSVPSRPLPDLHTAGTATAPASSSLSRLSVSSRCLDSETDQSYSNNNGNNSSTNFRESTTRQYDDDNEDMGAIRESNPRGGSVGGVDAVANVVVSAIPMIPVRHGGSDNNLDEEKSHMSSLTGHHGIDQELVEELHNALNELRTELEESRAEAARAVKVAEQAIQSAERNNSVEWQNTVTHKAAEAAALAQKRSASAMAKQRLAEERLEGERRSAAFWRKQAEVAEEEAGALQTRAAAAEVQRAAMEEQLDCERRIVSEQINSLRGRFTSTDSNQREALESAMERNRALEMELDATRLDLQVRNESILENNNNDEDSTLNKNRKNKRGFNFKKKGMLPDGPDSTSLLSDSVFSSSSAGIPSQSENSPSAISGDSLSTEQVLKVQAETQLMRQQFELLKRATSDHFEQLPENARVWGEQISQSLRATQTEAARLQVKLAMESASRRKLLHEVQDLRGAVRVYCRPRPCSNHKGLLSLPSHDTILLHRENYQDDVGPMSCEFDRVFDAQAQQQDVYSEIEDVCLGVLDGFNICLMTYGASQCGKTSTLLGDVIYSPEKIAIRNHGIHLQAMKQLFTIVHHRSERFKDSFSLTIIEVHNDRIRDLVSATQSGESRGQVMIAETKGNVARKQKTQEDDASSGKPSKLEIRTDIHGDTVVQGLVALEIKSFDEVIRIWEECLLTKSRRVEEQGLDQGQYDAASHVIATLRVKSMNIATGIGTLGKIQFVDLAAADLVPRRAKPDSEVSAGLNILQESDWRFANRSLETLSECIESRMQFERSVPYRNSTLTHLLRDSLEGDTKVLLIACVSSDPKDIHETSSTLKFASRIRRVTIGKATKHILSK